MHQLHWSSLLSNLQQHPKSMAGRNDKSLVNELFPIMFLTVIDNIDHQVCAFICITHYFSMNSFWPIQKYVDISNIIALMHV